MHCRQVSSWEFRSAEHGWNVREGVLHEATWRPGQPLDAEPSFIKRRSTSFKHQTFNITASKLKYCTPPTAHAAFTLYLFSDLTAFRPHTPTLLTSSPCSVIKVHFSYTSIRQGCLLLHLFMAFCHRTAFLMICAP